MPGSVSRQSRRRGTSVSSRRATTLRDWSLFAAKLVGRALLVAVAVVVIAFALMKLMPGSPLSAMLGARATSDSERELAAQLGIDRPWWQQLATLFINLLTKGDVGPSLASGESVRTLILARAGVSLSIVVLAMLIAVVVSLLLAVAAVSRPNGVVDHSLRLLLTAGVAIPAFWAGLVLILVFSVQLHWFPVAGVGQGVDGFLRSIVLPSVTAAIAIVPVIARSLRTQLLEVMQADFILAARAVGFSQRRIVFRHLVPNAAVPALTLVGTNFAYLVGGTFVVESVFSIPGLGDLMFRSIESQDATAVTGVVLFTAILVVIVNLVTDIVVRLVDPRLARGGSAL